MREQMEHRSHVSQPGVSVHAGNPESYHHEPDLRDRGERQHPLDVCLYTGYNGGVERGDRPDDGYKYQHIRSFQVIDGEQPSHEEYPGNHHCGGMNQCRYGGRTFHGVR